MGKHSDEGDSSDGRSSKLIALVAFLGVLIAYVVLAVLHLDTEALIRNATILLSVLGLGGFLNGKLQEQNKRLDKAQESIQRVTTQTNGVLDKRIADGAEAAIRKVLSEYVQEGVAMHPRPEPKNLR